MKRNYSDLIASKEKRQLTAKGYKFLTNCIEIASKQRGLTRYHTKMKPIKEKLKNIMFYLLIDKELSIEQIKEIVNNKKILENG